MIYQPEYTKEGQLHYQGYVQFTKQVNGLQRVKEIIDDNTAHIKVTKGTPYQNKRYCTKERSSAGEPVEVGSVRDADSGWQDIRNNLRQKRNLAEALDDDDLVQTVAKYPKFAELCIETRPLEQKKDFQLHPWQQQLLMKLAQDPDDRTIYWVVDPTGNTGKSWFADLLCRNYGAKELQAGHKEIAYYYQGEWIAVFDIPRNEPEEYVQYQVMEKLKDGKLFNIKYKSGMKRFSSPHVLVLSNAEPDETKFSADRWCIYRIVRNCLMKKNKESPLTAFE
jgi:hypothetical protein